MRERANNTETEKEGRKIMEEQESHRDEVTPDCTPTTDQKLCEVSSERLSDKNLLCDRNVRDEVCELVPKNTQELHNVMPDCTPDGAVNSCQDGLQVSENVEDRKLMKSFRFYRFSDDRFARFVTKNLTKNDTSEDVHIEKNKLDTMLRKEDNTVRRKTTLEDNIKKTTWEQKCDRRSTRLKSDRNLSDGRQKPNLEKVHKKGGGEARKLN